jgi:hypothetical protein
VSRRLSRRLRSVLSRVVAAVALYPIFCPFPCLRARRSRNREGLQALLSLSFICGFFDDIQYHHDRRLHATRFLRITAPRSCNSTLFCALESCLAGHDCWLLLSSSSMKLWRCMGMVMGRFLGYTDIPLIFMMISSFLALQVRHMAFGVHGHELRSLHIMGISLSTLWHITTIQ